ncbi:MAG: hypothetical protein RLZZ383_2867, partial [Pseudomonadota bacterium]
ESGDDFGAALAAGDYDGDGFADLAIGHPGEDIDGVADVGMFTVVFGAPSGLLNTRDQTFHQDSAGVPGSPESGDGMASVLAAGDSDGDARDELAVGLAGEAIGSVSDAGYVIVFRGAVGGLSTTGLFAVEGSDLGWSLGTGDALGAALAWGDVNADGWADLALGAPGRSVGGEDGAGTVALLWGGPSGLSTSGWLSFEQEPVPFIGSEAGDGHGSAVRLLDTDGDGDDEVVCGAPDEDLSGGSDAGMVTVFGVRSLSTADAQRWYQDMPDVGGDAEAGDGFGAAL